MSAMCRNVSEKRTPQITFLVTADLLTLLSAPLFNYYETPENWNELFLVSRLLLVVSFGIPWSISL